MKTIPLSTTKRSKYYGMGLVALVDDEDFSNLSKVIWTAKKDEGKNTFYAVGKINGKFVRMHRLVTKAPSSDIVDHVDGDGLNNCKDNLRLVNSKQNSRNRKSHSGSSSNYLGVSKYKYYDKGYKWRSVICVDGNSKSLGLYDTEREAALAYNDAASNHFGEYARLNIIED